MNWRRGWDSNPRYGLTPYNGLANRRLQPLGHPSAEERALYDTASAWTPLEGSVLFVKRDLYRSATSDSRGSVAGHEPMCRFV
jgi:hypothetical protein